MNLLKSIILSLLIFEYIYSDTLNDMVDMNQDLSLIPRDTLIEDARYLSIHQRLNEALRISKYVLDKNSEDIEAMRLYAKFLFWDSKLDRAYEYIKQVEDTNSVLYRQIYIAKSIKKLKSIKSNNDRVDYIKTLDSFAKSNYDVMQMKLQSFLKLSDMSSALRVAIDLKQKYPQSREANEIVAKLQFWNSKFQQSLDSYKELEITYGQGSYKKEISKLLNIINSKNNKVLKSYNPYAFIVSQIDKLYYDGYKDKAKELFDRQNTPLQEYIKSTYIELYNTLTMGHMAGMGYEYNSYSMDRDLDESFYIETLFPISKYTLYLKVEDTFRYKKEDIKLSGKFYPVLPKPFWGYLYCSITPDADFYSNYSIGWHQYYSLEHWEFSLGVDYSSYTDDSTTIFNGSYRYIIDGDLSAGQVLFYVPANGSWAVINRIKYAKPNHTYWSLEYIISYSKEKIESSSLFSGTDSQKIKVSTETALSDSMHLGMDLSFEYLKGENVNYSKNSISIFIKKYW